MIFVQMHKTMCTYCGCIIQRITKLLLTLQLRYLYFKIQLKHTHVHTYTHYAHTTHFRVLSLSISLPQNTHIRPRCLLQPLPDPTPAVTPELIDLDFITYLFHIRFIHNPPLVQPLHAVPKSVEQINQQAEKQPNGESYPGGRVQLSH